MTSALLAATASSYHAEKVRAIWITAILVLVVCGFLVPLTAGVRAKLVREDRGSVTAQERKQKRKSGLNRLAGRSAASVLLGADGRVSTSRSVAFAWTAIVVYVITALLLVWPGDQWKAALGNLYPTYFLFLGGPYASLILAKAITTYRTASGSLVKTLGDGTARLSDLIADDSGRTDLFDSQYVLFNVLAMWFVLAAFTHATLQGFPQIPNGLVLLTAGPAAVYLSNKLAGGTTPTISVVSPSRVTEGEVFSVRGTDLQPGQLAGVPGGSPSQVLVDGIAAPTLDKDWTGTAAVANAPNVGAQDGAAVDVQITTSGGTAIARGALTVDCRPRIAGFGVSSAAVGQDVTMLVDWPAQTVAGTRAVVRIGDVVVDGPVVTGPGRASCPFRVPPDLPAVKRGQVEVSVRASGPDSQPAHLLVQA